MIITLDWLKDFLPELSWTSDELSEKLLTVGHETVAIDEQTVDVTLNANRGDCASLFGIARELSAVFHCRLNDPPRLEIDSSKNFFALTVSRTAQECVLTDQLLVIDGYRHSASPDKIASRLKTIGAPSRNLIVDLTNIVAHEYGLPLHAFDFATLDGLELRRSVAGEQITLLNDRLINLPDGLLVQESRRNLVDLVGVMGAKNSSITSKTVTALLQAGVFEPSQVRLSSKSAALETPASWRYQRGVDPSIAPSALARYINLARVAMPELRFRWGGGFTPNVPRREIIVDLALINKLLDSSYEIADLRRLERLGFNLRGQSVMVPTWRYDVANLNDVAEELLRSSGFQAIAPKTLSPLPPKLGRYHQITQLKRNLVQAGFTEVRSDTFSPVVSALVVRQTEGEAKYLRPSLRASMLTVISRSPYLNKWLIFEIGQVFRPEETEVLGIAAVGFKDGALKGLSDKLRNTLGTRFELTAIPPSELKVARVKQSKVWLGEMVLAKLSLDAPRSLSDQSVHLATYRSVSKFPPIVRDVTLTVGSSESIESLSAKIRRLTGAFLTEEVDRFESETLGKGKIAATFRLTFQDRRRTMTDIEVTESLESGLGELAKTVQFQLR